MSGKKFLTMSPHSDLSKNQQNFFISTKCFVTTHIFRESDFKIGDRFYNRGIKIRWLGINRSGTTTQYFVSLIYIWLSVIIFKGKVALIFQKLLGSIRQIRSETLTPLTHIFILVPSSVKLQIIYIYCTPHFITKIFLVHDIFIGILYPH